MAPGAHLLATAHIEGRSYQANLLQPIDISMPLQPGALAPNCFYAPPFDAEPVVAGNFIGATAQGGVVNFMNVRINPHGNGTHTECVGHIAREPYSVNEALRRFAFTARLISVYPQRRPDGDRVIDRAQLEEALRPRQTEAVVIRTQPNDDLKLSANYSGANPPYLCHEAAALLADYGVEHLLLDLPSVDREEDGGQLLAHRAFWRYPQATRTQATITELVYVPDSAPDGLYLLCLHMASFELDASPSKPVLYALSAME
jgi:kynurenine formamidase